MSWIHPPLNTFVAKLPGINDFTESLILYCEGRLGDWPLLLPFLFEALVSLFPLSDASVRIETNLALECNGIVLNDDGLLVGLKDHLEFRKEGVLIGRDWGTYASSHSTE